jgi:DNA-binding IclR family transcriptional regulator
MSHAQVLERIRSVLVESGPLSVSALAHAAQLHRVTVATALGVLRDRGAVSCTAARWMATAGGAS